MELGQFLPLCFSNPLAGFLGNSLSGSLIAHTPACTRIQGYLSSPLSSRDTTSASFHFPLRFHCHHLSIIFTHTSLFIFFIKQTARWSVQWCPAVLRVPASLLFMKLRSSKRVGACQLRCSSDSPEPALRFPPRSCRGCRHRPDRKPHLLLPIGPYTRRRRIDTVDDLSQEVGMPIQ